MRTHPDIGLSIKLLQDVNRQFLAVFAISYTIAILTYLQLSTLETPQSLVLAQEFARLRSSNP